MHCPYCNFSESKVNDSRLAAEGAMVRRRRQCLSCHERFTTFESAEIVMPRIIKKSGAVQPFDEQKLRRALTLPLQKRPVSLDEVETMISRIKKRLTSMGEREIDSAKLGELVMSELRRVDAVAYVRFASVYLDFSDLSAFEKSIDELRAVKNDHQDDK